MGKFIIEPHFRLHEWVAEEKDYFHREGLEYEFRELVQKTDGQVHATPDRVGAFQSIEAGRQSNVSSACHWTVAAAASKRHSKLYASAYSISPAGVFVPANSPVKTPEDLAGVPISVGYQSGSHYSTIQALEQYLTLDEINLNFGDGMLFARMDKFLEGQSPACALFSGPYYFAEQLGFRKIIDTTFMMATSLSGDYDADDVEKFMRALRRAQHDIDLRPEKYTHHYVKEFPVRFHDRMDTRRWGPGERIVFEPYSKEIYEQTFRWIDERGIFDGKLDASTYETVIQTATD